MQRFEIVLRNEKIKFYQRFGWFILLILVLLFTWFGFFGGLPVPKGRTYVILVLLFVALLLWFYFRNTKYQFGLFIFLGTLTMGWIAREQYLFAGITLFFQFFHEVSLRKKNVIVADLISYPSFPVKKIQWIQLNNCMIKDGLLTIDFKTDKVIQQMIDETKTLVNEQEFNDFCKQQLKAKS